MTLTQAATLTKRGLIIFIVFLVVGISSLIGYQIWHQRQLAKLPPPQPKAEMKFGPLPKLDFPTSNVSSSNFSYSIDTTTGGLPKVPPIIKVYFIPKTGVTLLAPARYQKMANGLGFNSEPKVLSSTDYQFTNGKDGLLQIDLATGNFRLETLATPSAKLDSQTDKNVLIQKFKSYLADHNLLPDELKNGRSNINLDDATTSLWPSNIDDLPIVNANFADGLVQTTITIGDNNQITFNKINYIFWPIDKTSSSTYFLKSADQALADLKSGLGFISLEPQKPQVSISSVYLAYFEQNTYTPYLQPVFVFEGPGFAALVPAIKIGN
ncbi:hypothetical protein HY385_01990 [Candidatus Daviesbacteria bacterium]|nr:hypothetical protein [Candidatus Daviesbacteria bacterium]